MKNTPKRPKVLMKTLIIVGVLLILAVAYLVAGPYLTIAAIKTDIVENDSDGLSEKIDFPLLRQNLKDQLHAAMMKNADKELENHPLSGFTAGLATGIAARIVDSFVTPDGLASLMQGKTPTKSDGAQPKERPMKENLLKNARFSYDSTSQFSVWVASERGQEARFILERNGMTWKLVNLALPTDQDTKAEP